MSASLLVLDLLRAHWAGDEQKFKTMALRLAGMTKSEDTRKTMLDVIRVGSKRAFDHASQETIRRGPQPTQMQPQQLQQLPQAPQSSMLEPIQRMSFEELLLDDNIAVTLEAIVEEIQNRDALAERKLKPRCRLLFYGAPGNGKSSSAGAIARALDVPAYGVSIPDLVSKYIGETGSNLGRLFKEITDDRVVVFDEIDCIGTSRTAVGASADSEKNSTVDALLTLLDRVHRGVLVCTTNRADILDPALLRRFDERIEFPAPNAAQMRALARRLEKKHDVEQIDITGCENFDAVTKRVVAEARRIVMDEIRAAKAAETED